MTQKRVLRRVMAVLVTATLTTTCEEAPVQPGSKEAPVQPFTSADAPGIYHFDTVGEHYARSLALFLKEHPELRCSYAGADERIRNNGSASYAYTVGHYIMCTDTAENAQDETIP